MWNSESVFVGLTATSTLAEVNTTSHLYLSLQIIFSGNFPVFFATRSFLPYQLLSGNHPGGRKKSLGLSQNDLRGS